MYFWPLGMPYFCYLISIKHFWLILWKCYSSVGKCPEVCRYFGCCNGDGTEIKFEERMLVTTEEGEVLERNVRKGLKIKGLFYLSLSWSILPFFPGLSSCLISAILTYEKEMVAGESPSKGMDGHLPAPKSELVLGILLPLYVDDAPHLFVVVTPTNSEI